MTHRPSRSEDLEPSPDSADTRPLVITADEPLLDEVVRLCAAAGVEAQVAGDTTAGRRHWFQAPLVVLGDDLAGQMCESAPPRRQNVAVVTTDADDAGVWVRAVGVGADQVYAVPAEQDRMIEVLANCLDGAAPEARVIAVVGGSGGAGASCFAGALALTAARSGDDTLLVDADPLGGGIDMVLGNEEVNGLRWPDLAMTHGRINGRSLRQALPRVAGLSMLSWDRGDLLAVPADSLRSVLVAGQRAHDLVVVDVPRRLDPAAEEVLARASITVLVVTAEIRAVAASARVLGRLRQLSAPIGLVVRGPGPTGLDADLVSDTLELPLMARMRHDTRAARAIDDGLGPSLRRRSALMAASRRALERVPVLEGRGWAQ